MKACPSRVAWSCPASRNSEKGARFHGHQVCSSGSAPGKYQHLGPGRPRPRGLGPGLRSAAQSSLLAAGTKSDRVDADKLSELLRLGALRSVHERSEVAVLRELVGSYQAIVQDTTRVMLRLKSIFRARAIECHGTSVYHPRKRSIDLDQLGDRGARRRAEHLYAELDQLMALRAVVRRQLLEEAKRHSAVRLLRTIPEIVAIVVTPIASA